MNKDDFYNELLNLAFSTYDASSCDFRDHLKYILNRYLELLDELNTRQDYIDEIKMIKDVIISAVNSYYRGRHSNAFNKIRICINKYLLCDYSYLFVENYYRIRKFDEGEEPNRMDMFHIPFNKRTIVKTQRYSAPGYPCLYLGTSAYVCWEEMGKPNLDQCYFARFHKEEMMIQAFDFSFPTKARWTDENFFIGELYRYPFVLASMVKVAKPEDPFKPEYIIPQLLMEYVIEESIKHKEYFGIFYTSVHRSKHFDFNPDIMRNLVLPTTPNLSKKDKYSDVLCKMFKVTDPTSDELERAKRPYEIIERDEKISDLEYSYRISTFGQLEKRLEEFKLYEIKNSKYTSSVGKKAGKKKKSKTTSA